MFGGVFLATITYKCPNCDGGLTFNPENQDFFCEYCLSHFTQEQLDEMIKDKQSTEKVKETTVDEVTGATKEVEILLYKCPSCGAEVITDNTTVSTFCHYCHNPIILEGKLQGEFSPDGFIPFKKTKDEIKQEFLQWTSKKWFIPNAFFNKKNIEKMSGVYYPYWITDYKVDVNAYINAEKIRVWRTGNTEYTERSYYKVQRRGEVELRDITNNALKSADAKLAEAVLPYDYADIKDFNTGYLSGFLAENRDIDKENLTERSQDIMKDYSKRIIKADVKGYDVVDIKNFDVDIKEEKWRYVLLPVWMLTYKNSKDDIYYYAVNGQTGEVCGKLPLDNKKLGLLFAGLFIGFSLLTFLGGLLFL